MKKKLTKKQAVDLFTILTAVKRHPGSGPWVNMVRKNLKALGGTYNAFIAHEVNTPEIKAFAQARQETQIKYADKDKDGKPIIRLGNIIIPDKAKDKFEKAMAKLKEDHQEAQRQMDEMNAQAEEWLTEEITIELATAKETTIPDGLTPEILEGLELVIDETESKIITLKGAQNG